MGIFLEDLKAFLSGHVYNIFRDTMPDQPDDAVGLFLYAHAVGGINDGTGVRHVQVQVRRKDPDEAYTVACELCALLDSGVDEALIDLAPGRWCIARPTALPKKLGVDESGRTTYYFETGLWGSNDP